MKSILLSLMFIIPFILAAQPVIPISWTPQIGDEWKVAVTNEVPDVSESGQNVTWDISSVTLSPEPSNTYLFKDPSDGPNSECYPNASIGASISVDGYDETVFSYYEQTQSGFRALGDAAENQFKSIYSDPIDYRFIDLTYGNSESDDYKSVISAMGIETEFEGNVSYNYDAYGTLILPQGPVEDVVRIYQTVESVTTNEANGLMQVVESNSTIYAFIAEGSIFPVAQWQTSESSSKTYFNGDLVDSTFISGPPSFSINPDYSAPTSAGSLYSELSMEIYPTVAGSALTIHSQEQEQTIYVASVLGNNLKDFYVNKGGQEVDISDLESGHYFVTDRHGRLIDRFIKQ